MGANAVERASALIRQLRAEGDADVRADLALRYGIHTDNATGLSMSRMKALARPLAPDHELAGALWESGLYEARTIAAHVDDPIRVDVDQMNRWCCDFDNWAITDTTCFALFDRTPDAWAMVEPWAHSDGEFSRRAGFALLWALALHDTAAPNARFADALPLIEAHADDPRPLVGKAQTMALRAILQKRPGLRVPVDVLVRRLLASDDAATMRVARPIAKVLVRDRPSGAD